MREKLDKIFIHHVLHEKSWTAYKLAKQTGLSQPAILNYANGKRTLPWSTVVLIEKETGVTFGSPEHFMFGVQHPELFE